MKKSLIGLSAILIFVASCVDAEKEDKDLSLDIGGTEIEVGGLVEQQVALEAVFSACKDSNIKSKEDLEKIIEAGGNGLDRLCKKSIQNIDVSKLTVSIELPDFTEGFRPFEDLNNQIALFNDPLHNEIDAHKLLIHFPDSVSVNSEDLQLWAKKGKAGFVQMKTSVVEKFPVGFTVDYSGSMFEEDIVYALAWANKIQNLDKHIGVSLVEFSEDVHVKKNAKGLGPLLYNSEIKNTSTSLYDAWGKSLQQLDQIGGFALNIVITDGAENSSVEISRTRLKEMISQSNVFNLVFASGFVSKGELNDLTQEKGIWFYEYSLVDADELLTQAEQFMENLYVYDLGKQNLNEYDSAFITLGIDTLSLVP